MSTRGDSGTRRRVPLIVAWLAMDCVLVAQAAHALRAPVSPEELVDRADVVATVTVLDRGLPEYDPDEDLGKTSAFVHLDVPALKGEVRGSQVAVFLRFWEELRPRPVQLETGGRYLLFLVRTNADEYELADDLAGAVPLERVDIARIRSAVERDRRLEEQFQHVRIEARLHENQVSIREAFLVTLLATNTGDEDVRLRGELVDEGGRLVLRGWTSLVMERIREGQVVSRRQLAYADSHDLPQIVLPAGGTREWTGRFGWGKGCLIPGHYRLTWQLAKATSEPVGYRVVPRSSFQEECLGPAPRSAATEGAGDAPGRPFPSAGTDSEETATETIDHRTTTQSDLNGTRGTIVSVSVAAGVAVVLAIAFMTRRRWSA